MKKELKGFVCGFTAMAVLSVGVASASGFWDTINVLRNDISVVVNGENITADNFVYNDTTYLPLRAVSEALNQPVSYDENSNTAYIGVDSNNQTQNANNSQTAYYAEVPWCPDYGSVTGAKVLYSKDINDDTDIGYGYTYSVLDGDEHSLVTYYETLKAEGFQLNVYSTSELAVFYKGKYTVVIGVDKDKLLVTVLANEEK